MQKDDLNVEQTTQYQITVVRKTTKTASSGKNSVQSAEDSNVSVRSRQKYNKKGKKKEEQECVRLGQKYQQKTLNQFLKLQGKTVCHHNSFADHTSWNDKVSVGSNRKRSDKNSSVAQKHRVFSLRKKQLEQSVSDVLRGKHKGEKSPFFDEGDKDVVLRSPAFDKFLGGQKQQTQTRRLQSALQQKTALLHETRKALAEAIDHIETIKDRIDIYESYIAETASSSPRRPKRRYSL